MSTVEMRRAAFKRELAVVAVLVVVGLGLGLGAARLLAGEPRVSQVDYAVLVAQLYERERSAPNAVERLVAGGIANPAESVARMAQSHPTATADADPAATQRNAGDTQSLRELAQGLGRPPAEAAPVPRPSPQTWLLPLVVFVFVLILGALLAFRILGIRLPRPARRPVARRYSVNGRGGLPGGNGAVGLHPSRQPGQSPAAAFRGSAVVRPREEAEPLPPVDVDDEPEEEEYEGEGDEEAAAEPPAAVPTATAPRPRSQYRFRSSYHFGDEPYDEIHPIGDPRTGALLGACGVSAVRRLKGTNGTRFWGFTAWIQDYVGQAQQLKAIGLVSKWAYLNYGEEIDDWLRSGQIDEVKQVERGAAIQVETACFVARLSVEEYEFGEGIPPEAYFTRLAAQFDVDARVPAGQSAATRAGARRGAGD